MVDNNTHTVTELREIIDAMQHLETMFREERQTHEAILRTILHTEALNQQQF